MIQGVPLFSAARRLLLNIKVGEDSRAIRNDYEIGVIAIAS
jgi:hypothetical protein